MAGPQVRFDQIGYWSEIKLDIVRDYATAYSKILTAQTHPPLYHVYIDGFAGAGVHISKTSGDFVRGSPANALLVQPPFREFYWVDLHPGKAAALKDLAAGRPDVRVYEGDANAVLLSKVFPNVRYEQYRRGLCLLDPYGLHLNWDVIATAGQMKSIDMFLNFPVADMNRNVIWRHPENVRPKDIQRMNAFWGDESWRDIAYSRDRNLFGYPEKEDNETVAEGFRKRLQEVAAFAYVPKPLAMRNSTGAIVYYLFFASQKPVAGEIVQHIFNKYEKVR